MTRNDLRRLVTKSGPCFIPMLLQDGQAHYVQAVKEDLLGFFKYISPDPHADTGFAATRERGVTYVYPVEKGSKHGKTREVGAAKVSHAERRSVPSQ